MADANARPFTAASFNQVLLEQRLAGSRCTDCGALHVPPRALCPHCYGERMEWAELSGRGELAAFTSIYVGPSAMVAKGHDRAHPYVSGLVRLEEGPVVSARILGVDAAKPDLAWIGSPVSVTFLIEGEGDARIPTLAFTVQGSEG